MTGDCCVFKFLRRSVDGEHLIRFQGETSVFKFLRGSVDQAWVIVWKLEQIRIYTTREFKFQIALALRLARF